MISDLCFCRLRRESQQRIGEAGRTFGRDRFARYGSYAAFFFCCFIVAALPTASVEAQTKKVRVAVPGYTIAVLSFLAAKMNAMGAADTRFTALVSGAIDASMLIAPVSFYAKDQGFRELAAFQDLGFALPSGGIVARDETLKSDPLTTERFVRSTIMGFFFMRDNRPGTLKVMSRMLRIDDATAAKLYDSSRPTMTRDGTVAGDVEKKMTAMVLKIAGLKDAPPSDKLYDFSLVRKAHAALQAKGWRAVP